jgi:hypothetical protein
MIRRATISSLLEGTAASAETRCDGWIVVKAINDRLERSIIKQSSAYLLRRRCTELIVVDIMVVSFAFRSFYDGCVCQHGNHAVVDVSSRSFHFRLVLRLFIVRMTCPC